MLSYQTLKKIFNALIFVVKLVKAERTAHPVICMYILNMAVSFYHGHLNVCLDIEDETVIFIFWRFPNSRDESFEETRMLPSIKKKKHNKMIDRQTVNASYRAEI